MKKKWLIVLMTAAVCMTGCSARAGTVVTESNESLPEGIVSETHTEETIEESQSETSVSQTIEPESTEEERNRIGWGDQKEQPLDLINYSLDYQFDTDFQSSFQWTDATRNETGYYFLKDAPGLEDGLRLCYFDEAAGRYIILCSKPDCAHTDDSCNAYLETNPYKGTDIFLASYIQYYEGGVYVAARGTEGYVNLYRIAADGSTRDKVMPLFKQLEDKTSAGLEFRYPYVCIHRGYVYFINNMSTKNKIFRIKLGGDTQELVYENDGERPLLYRMKAYGDFLFFQSGNFWDEKCIDITSGIYAYNIHTGEVTLVKKDAISEYQVLGHDLYYDGKGTVECYSLDESVGKGSFPILLTDFYVDSERVIYYDNGGNHLGVYDTKNGEQRLLDGRMWQMIFGDGAYLLAKGDSDPTTGCDMHVLKRSEALQDGQWELMRP